MVLNLHIRISSQRTTSFNVANPKGLVYLIPLVYIHQQRKNPALGAGLFLYSIKICRTGDIQILTKFIYWIYFTFSRHRNTPIQDFYISLSYIGAAYHKLTAPFKLIFIVIFFILFIIFFGRIRIFFIGRITINKTRDVFNRI